VYPLKKYSNTERRPVLCHVTMTSVLIFSTNQSAMILLIL